MVTIIDVKTITTEEGKEFNFLVVQGSTIEPLISKKTGKIYFTVRKANVPATFSKATCKTLIGTELPGTVEKIKCEPYEYTVTDTGEIITLEHNWLYIDPDVINANAQIINSELVN